MSDLISRKWLMECVDEGWIEFDTEKDTNTYIHLVRDIAPSVQPKTCAYWDRESNLCALHRPSAQRKGKWIHGREISRDMIGDCVTAIFYEGWKCSECTCLVEEYRKPLWNYCPNCGARMEK